MENNGKTIYYCWFGFGKKPRKVVKCINSWKHFFPEYKIVEINEASISIDRLCNYAKEAYSAKKWAFVTDYVRFKMLKENGGVFFDTDVLVLKRIPQEMLNNLLALENDKTINPGLIMSVNKGDTFSSDMMRNYENEHFITDDGYNTYTVCQRATDYFLKKGFVPNNTYQNVCGYNIYPSEYFCPIDYSTMKCKKTKNTYTMHLYMGSWLGKKERRNLILSNKISKIIGPKKRDAALRFLKRLKRKN